MRVPFQIAFPFFVAIVAVYGLGIALGLFIATKKGNPVLAVVFTFGASIIPMFAIGWLLEDRNVLNPIMGSWTFIFGDSIALPFVAFALSMAFRNTEVSPQLWMFAVCLALGFVVSWAFRMVDNGQYSSAQLLSPTKIVHDWIAYVVLAGFLIGLDVWALWHQTSRAWGLTATIGFGLWLALGVADSFRHTPAHHIPYVWP